MKLHVRTKKKKNHNEISAFQFDFNVCTCYILSLSPSVLIIGVSDAKFTMVLYSDLPKELHSIF